MERLTKTWSKNCVATNFDYMDLESVEDCTFKELDRIIQKLGKLEDLVEQKKILEIPYKIGDTIYDFKPFVEGYGDAEIFETLVTEICIHKDRSGRLLFVVDDGNETFYADDFGKVAFLDREEAERKLEEIKNEKSNCRI